MGDLKRYDHSCEETMAWGEPAIRSYMREIADGDYVQYKQAANLIEQLQARITELEAQVRSIALSREELAATVERLSTGLLHVVASQYHGDDETEWSIAANHVFKLFGAEISKLTKKTPHQNLNTVKREVYADGYYDGFCDAWHSNHDWEQDHVHYGLKQSEIKAEQEYPIEKE